jgi:hypothetical protein
MPAAVSALARTFCPTVLPPLVEASQHLKPAGPGQRFDTVVPEHWLVQRQFPPLPHDVFVQHLMLSGVPGQAPVMYVPPLEEQDPVSMQTPGAPPLPVHGPFSMLLRRMEEEQAIPAKAREK